MLRRSELVPLVAALGLAASGCGASDPVAAEEVSAAVARTASERSSRIEIRGEDGDEKVVMRGVADHERRRASFTYDATSSEGKPITGAKLLAIGSTIYVETSILGLAESPPAEPEQKPWSKIEGIDEAPTLNTLLFPFPFIEPGRLLAAFERVSGKVEALGKETVRGVETDHYRLTLELERLIETAPARDRAGLRKELEARKSKTQPVEIWIDDAGLARRVRVVVESDPVTIDFFDFGVEVDVEAPPDDQVEDFDAFFGVDYTEVGSGEIEPEPKEDE